ncbi:MAGUK p55 subfamily member 2 [Labeo rohita]|uniref:MAGUK p55 subfamily member 2 n=1 Tax=Labeo rohita TaxID=84645 RepID=A0ABQ8M747_LABRO|nr:MAGUK p55 subfamily member 2 [Labeo rohita]
MQSLLDTLSDSTSSTTANDLDLIFLKGIMESPVSREHYEEPKLEAVRDNNVELVQDILRDLTTLTPHSQAAHELACILKEPHFQSLLETHDSVASKSYETPPPSPCAFMDPALNNQPVPPDAVRMVGIRKVSGEHLGLLHVGDIIKEVNGKEVGSDPKVLQNMLKESSGSVVLKILPSYQEPHTPRQAFVKCHFDYDPSHDNLIPCSAGLIPSQLLEEKRKAFVKRDLELSSTVLPGCVLMSAGPLCAGIGGKKKKKMMYLTTKNAEFDRHELRIYEEVAKVPPFRRKTLVLIGAQDTSRKPKVDEKEGQMYLFMSRSEMETDIKCGRFLEHGEYDGNLYGTKIDSIHEALKVLRTAEFLPYVVFIEAPNFEVLKDMNRSAIEAGVVTKQLTDSELKRTVDESERIQRAYSHYFDLSIVNDNLDGAYRSLRRALDRLNTDHQWVPVSWVF